MNRPVESDYTSLTAYTRALEAYCHSLQPEQEPVLWMMPDGNTADKWALQFYGGQKGKPLYTTPPQCKTLTDKEIEAIWEVAMFAKYGVGAELSNQPFVHFARAIEAKLKEKNT